MVKQFKAFIRVVKSIAIKDQYGFDKVQVIHEPLIEAKDKDEAKNMMLKKYPQFFQNDKVYQRETKDGAQFFYLLVYPLYEWEKRMINEGNWVCEYCGQVHENKYVSRPIMNQRLLGSDKLFCRSDDSYCIDNYTKEKYPDLPDEAFYIKENDPIYIYKCTEKKTNKSYIGKTKNAPFFRWYNHLTHSKSPFGEYLRQTPLSSWAFEVLYELPFNTPDDEVFKIESKYILEYNSINNGFNSVISNKEVISNSSQISFLESE